MHTFGILAALPLKKTLPMLKAWMGQLNDVVIHQFPLSHFPLSIFHSRIIYLNYRSLGFLRRMNLLNAMSESCR